MNFATITDTLKGNTLDMKFSVLTVKKTSIQIQGLALTVTRLI